MHDLDKAKLLLHSTKISLKALAEELDIPYTTIRRYSANPSALESAEAVKVRLMAQKWDKNPTFNLLKEPWIKVLDENYAEREVSLIDFFKNANSYAKIAGEMEIQNISILRFTLSILLTVYSRFDSEGKSYDWLSIKWDNLSLGKVDLAKYDEKQLLQTWEKLYKEKNFNQILFTYLNKHKEDFDLFGDRPFYQVNAETYDKHVEYGRRLESGKGIVHLKWLNRTISESNNTPAIFSPRSQSTKNKLTFSELTRWLITYQNYTATIDKTKVLPVDFPESAGWPYRLTSVYATTGESLYDTLMLNLSLIDETHKYKVQKPFWEFDREEYLNHRLRLLQPENQAESYTLWSRMLHVGLTLYGEPLVYSAGLPKMVTTNAFEEPMAIWKKKNSSFVPAISSNKSYYDPIWFKWENIISPSDEDHHQPTIIFWLDYLCKQNKIDAHEELLLRQVALTNDGTGASQLPISEKVNMNLINFDTICNKDNRERAITCAKLAKKVTNITWSFIDRTEKLNRNTNSSVIADSSMASFQYKIDFTDILIADKETTEQWLKDVVNVALEIGDEVMQKASPRAIRGINGQNIYTLHNQFKGQLLALLKKATASL